MRVIRRVAVIALPVALACASVAGAQSRIGEQEFAKTCGACHGADGRGNSPMLDLLKNAPPDLTMISARNGGVFPIQYVYDTIADVGGTRAHGTSEMPIWGDRFNMEAIAEAGEMGSSRGGVSEARARILELVFFLATIQEQ